MEDQWDFKASGTYKGKVFAGAAFAWIGFNAITGVFTGNHALIDNYFVLVVFLLVAAFKSSYRVTYKNGFVATYQLGMVTNSINLYEATHVELGKTGITVHYPGDTKFVIKCSRLPATEHERVRASIKALDGERPPTAESPITVVEQEHEAKHASQVISGGVTGVALSILALATGTLYLPRGHVVSSSDPGNTFYYYVAACFFGGLLSVAYGYHRKRKMLNK